MGLQVDFANAKELTCAYCFHKCFPLLANHNHGKVSPNGTTVAWPQKPICLGSLVLDDRSSCSVCKKLFHINMDVYRTEMVDME